MAKVDIFSGFLGAGKTTLIRKLIEEAYQGERVVLIENEFGEIGVDSGFLKDSGVTINEMNSGCICCSLVGDFGIALNNVVEQFKPDRILIEPSGVGKLSDVILAVENLNNEEIQLNGFTTVVDAKKCKMYMKNFGEFFNNQIENASAIVLSHTDGLSDEKMDQCIKLLREHNSDAEIITTAWDKLTGVQILEIMEKKSGIAAELARLEASVEEHHHEHHGHHHHHHNHDYDHDQDHECCHHDHDHDHDQDHECCHHDNDHDHDQDHECCHHDHDHDHDQDHECCHHDHDHDHDHHHECCHHDHDHHHDHEHEHHHHHHHADEVFQSVGIETSHKFTKEEIEKALSSLGNFAEYGQVLRAKGIVEGQDGQWIHFDYVPGEPDVRIGGAVPTGMICVIGAGLEEDAVRELFGV